HIFVPIGGCLIRYRLAELRLLILAFFLTVLIFAVRVSVSAKEEAPRSPVVLMVVRPLKADSDRKLLSVIADSLRLEMRRAGLEIISVNKLGGDPLAGSIIQSQTIDLSQLFALAETQQADFVLVATYSEEASSVSLTCEVYDTRKKVLTASASRTSRLGLNLDEIIAECVRELVDKVGGTWVNLHPARDLKKEPVPSEGKILAEREAPPDIGERKRAEEEEAFKRFQFTLGFAPFLVVGRASEFFKTGLSPSFYAGYWLKLPFGRLGFGLYVSIILFQPEDIEVTSSSFFIPLGGDVRYATGGASPLSLYLRASGGPAILLLNLNELGPQSKVVYYLLGGIGLEFALTRWFGLTLDSSYTLFFEGEEPIMGYIPSLYLSLKL
ncbi:MAG TPA: hypothetical protein VMX75_14125, partial [Spirochaetia bacterium]|nr:hypothetical protein [Spirochaetia bacterium]